MAEKNDVIVKFDKVQKSYDGEILVVKNLNLDIDRGEFLTMLGPSGSGKTTCLMMLSKKTTREAQTTLPWKSAARHSQSPKANAAASGAME